MIHSESLLNSFYRIVLCLYCIFKHFISNLFFQCTTAVPASWLTTASLTPSIDSRVFLLLPHSVRTSFLRLLMFFPFSCPSTFFFDFIFLSFSALCTEKRFKRNALVTTQKLDKLIAAAPNIGFNFQPKNGSIRPPPAEFR